MNNQRDKVQAKIIDMMHFWASNECNFVDGEKIMFTKAIQLDQTATPLPAGTVGIIRIGWADDILGVPVNGPCIGIELESGLTMAFTRNLFNVVVSVDPLWSIIPVNGIYTQGKL
jgi:hypothetical protein